MSVDLTTLTHVKEYLGIAATPVSAAPSSTDVLLGDLITRASTFMNTLCSRQFLSANYTDTLDGNGSTRQMLKNRPITAVSAVTISGVSVPSGGSATKAGFWFDERMVYVNGYRFSIGQQNVVVAYTSGFSAAPADVEEICIELVANKYKRKDRIGEESKNLQGQVVSFSKRDLSEENVTALNRYNQVAPV